MDKNIEYYNENAEAFFAGTVNADMSLWRDRFQALLPDGGRVLDLGCGSGRDSLAFKRHGKAVVALDASSKMCEMASKLIGQEVLQMRFDEIAFKNEFDGIWACASLLHVPNDELPSVLGKVKKALKRHGILYISFKFGEGTTKRGERSFSDHTDVSVRKLLNDAGFDVSECGVTSDIRPGRADEKWVNAIAKARMKK
ncbi:MAG: class I SAM-dependent methyltransferase [Lachnospiraceae bacterium]|nr:class I SAM-dependent methyltransferase [Lachnospiraceae bacterium]